MIFACLIPIGIDGIRVWQGRARAISDSERDTSNLARSISQHAEDAFRMVDSVLGGLVERLENDGQGPEALIRLRKLLIARAPTLPPVQLLAVFDQEGKVVVGSLQAAPEINIADRDYFWFHRDSAGRESHISKPVRNRLNNEWMIPLTRRFNNPDGSFAGVVLAAIDIAYFQKYYGTFDIGKEGSIILVGGDGTLLMRYPFDEAKIGLNLAGGAMFEALRNSRPAGNLDARSVTDGIERLASYRRVEGYPLVIAVARQKNEVLARWRAAMWINGISDLGAVAVMALLGVLLARQAGFRTAAQRSAEEAIAQYRLLAENTSDLIMLIGPDRRRLYVSPACRDMVGYTPDELIGLPVGGLVHPDDRIDWASPHDISHGSEAKILQATYRVLHKNGSPVWVEAHRRPLPEGGYIVSMRDISLRKRMEADLERSRRHLAHAQRVARLGYWVGDEATQTAVWSPEMFEIFGIPEMASVPRSVGFERVHPEDRPRLLTARRQSIETRTRLICEYRIVRPDGDIRWVHVEGEPEYDSTGRHTGFFGIAQDITEQRAARVALQVAKEEAERANQAKAMFLANMSHELRTPLNAVIGFSDIIEHEALGSLGNPKYREYAADIRSSGEHLLSMINDVLDHTKAEQGYLELNEVIVEIAGLIDFVVHMLAPRAERDGVVLRTTISPDVYALRGDERRLRQIVLNLVTNAVKFTPGGGRISIDASRSIEGEFVLTVEDTGIGISVDDQQKILEPFVQAGGSGISSEGTGLGLPLTKRLIELHGGSLDLRSSLGVGTIFYARLPASRLIVRDDCSRQIADLQLRESVA